MEVTVLDAKAVVLNAMLQTRKVTVTQLRAFAGARTASQLSPSAGKVSEVILRNTMNCANI